MPALPDLHSPRELEKLNHSVVTFARSLCAKLMPGAQVIYSAETQLRMDGPGEVGTMEVVRDIVVNGKRQRKGYGFMPYAAEDKKHLSTLLQAPDQMKALLDWLGNTCVGLMKLLRDNGAPGSELLYLNKAVSAYFDVKGRIIELAVWVDACIVDPKRMVRYGPRPARVRVRTLRTYDTGGRNHGAQCGP